MSDPTTHPGCDGERAANGVHRAQFCIFCLRKVADDLELEVERLKVDRLKTALRDERPAAVAFARDVARRMSVQTGERNQAAADALYLFAVALERGDHLDHEDDSAGAMKCASVEAVR